MRISVADINPFVLNMGTTVRQHHKTMVRAYDCRLLYILEGSCQLTLTRILRQVSRARLE